MLVRFTGVSNKLPIYIAAEQINFVYHSINPLGTVIATRVMEQTPSGLRNLCYVVMESSAECAERINDALKGDTKAAILAAQ